MKNMANILGSLQHARETPMEEETIPVETAPEPAVAAKPTTAINGAVPKPKAEGAPVQTKTVGKSSNPDFEPVKVLLRKTTRKKAERKWNDAMDQDFSDLVEHLLQEYLGRGN